MTDTKNPRSMNRRAFLSLTVVGAAALSFPEITGALETEHTHATEADSSGAFRIQSGLSRLAPWTKHFHYLDVPIDWIENPPAEGVSIKTTKTLLHWHQVHLTQNELRAIAGGKTVTVEDNVGDHQYSIRLP